MSSACRQARLGAWLANVDCGMRQNHGAWGSRGWLAVQRLENAEIESQLLRGEQAARLDGIIWTVREA